MILHVAGLSLPPDLEDKICPFKRDELLNIQQNQEGQDQKQGQGRESEERKQVQEPRQEQECREYPDKKEEMQEVRQRKSLGEGGKKCCKVVIIS
jgi:hypothetical protein